MKTEVKKINSTQRELSIEVSAEAVKDKFNSVFERISKEAKVSGFRPGNAPRDIIEKNFSVQARETVLKELLPEAYHKAIETEALEAIDLPYISEVKLERDSLSFKAKVDVFPEIKLKDYKGLKVEWKKIEVTPDEVKRFIDSLKESRKAGAVDDNFARSLAYINLATMEDIIAKQLFLQKENLQRQKIEDGILEELSKDLDFQLPQSLIERDLEELIKQTNIDWALRGVPQEKIQEQEKDLREKLEPQAKKRVKVYLVLSAIAKKENIPLDQDMPKNALGFLLSNADWQEK